MQRGSAGIGMLERGMIEPRFEPGRGAVRERLVGTRTANRRHGAGPELPDDFFPHVRVFADLFHVQRVEREPGSLDSRVVAGDAVLVEHGAGRRARRLRRFGPPLHGLRHRHDDRTQHPDERQAMRRHRLFSFPSGIAAAHGGGHFISFAPSARSNAAVCGCAANELPYSTPSATISGVRPSMATTSSLAPLSNRYFTTLFAPRYAAACIAVSPRSLTAFTSAPSSSTISLTASST